MGLYNVFDEPKRQCTGKEGCEGVPLWGIGICRDCFREEQEKKSIEERLLDLEISNRTPHHHLNNMIFGGG